MTRQRGAYMREYQRKWKAARRAKWLSENGPCARCGATTDLEVDHVDPSTKVDHKIWSWSQKRREIELAKCQVLCGGCHLLKTKSETPEPEHGTRQRYDAYGCRCDECREKKRKHNKQQQSRRVSSDWKST